MASFFAFVVILGVLIIVHEFGHFIVAKRVGVRVEKFALGFGPRIIVRKRRDTEYRICAIPLGGYVKLAGDNLEEFKGQPDEYLAQPPGKRFKIIFFGPLLNYLLGFLCFWVIFFTGYPNLTTKVGGLIDGLGAREAGIQIGDRIIRVDGKKVDFWDELQRVIQSKAQTTKVKITLLRGDVEHNLEVDIRQKPLEDILGQKRRVGLIGIMPEEETVIVKHGVVESFFLSLGKSWELTAMTYKAFWRILTGRLDFREAVTGPLGIYYITSQATKLGITAILHVMALLNISLCLFNLLPLPILDGGHILLLGIEKIRGRGLSEKAERIFTQVGLSLIISLAVLVVYNDLVRFGIVEKVVKLWR